MSKLSIKSAEDSALSWASESNAYVCSTVLTKGLTYVENTDLSGAYTTSATPVVSLQMAKQGYRWAIPPFSARVLFAGADGRTSQASKVAGRHCEGLMRHDGGESGCLFFLEPRPFHTRGVR